MKYASTNADRRTLVLNIAMHMRPRHRRWIEDLVRSHAELERQRDFAQEQFALKQDELDRIKGQVGSSIRLPVP